MWDEDVGRPVTCPFCLQDDQCVHLLAVVDKSIVGCRHGEFSNYFGRYFVLLEDAFGEALNMDQSIDWSDELVRELWDEAVDEYANDSSYIAINGYLAMRLLVSLLQESEGVEYSGNEYEGGGPGLSSAVSVFYAENPGSVCNHILTVLGERLQSEY